MDFPSQQIAILNLEVDEGGEESDFRFLVSGRDVKYVSIDPGVYDANIMVFAPDLLPQLPPFPNGDWNVGRIGLGSDSGKATFLSTKREELPSVRNIWHSRSVDFLSLKVVEELTANVHKVWVPGFQQPVIAKFARFPWEIGYLEDETSAYERINSQHIGPEFLGHIREGDRTIGFLIEELVGRHAEVEDLCKCCEVVERLHNLGFAHNDLNKFNFIVTKYRAHLLDFEQMTAVVDKGVMQAESKRIEAHLRDKSDIGGVTVLR